MDTGKTVKCVRPFVAKDPTTQLELKVDEEFVVLRQERPGWAYVRRRGGRQEGIIPLSCVREK